MSTLTDLFTNIANVIRKKTAKTDIIIADNFPSEIEAIETKIDYVNDKATIIGDYAYYGIDTLKSASLYNATSIGDYAFAECKNLESITIANSEATIGINAIPNNDGIIIYGITGSTAETYATENNIAFIALQQWDVSASTEDNVVATYYPLTKNLVFSGTGNMRDWIRGTEDPSNPISPDLPPWKDIVDLQKSTILQDVTNIGDCTFYGCKSLTSITIPDSVIDMGYRVFQNCALLMSVVIPNSVISIGDYAFYGCSNLSSIEIPNSVTTITGNVFNGCSNLTNVVIPNSVTSIGWSAFEDCTSLTSIEIPNSVTSIGSDAFRNCSSLTSIEIPNSVTSIGKEAFSHCSSLTSIEIPNSVTTISQSTFYGCSNLTSIEIPNSVTSIGANAFKSCTSLTSIEIPNGVTTIGDWAFRGCKSLISIEVPNSTTNIGDYAFAECAALTSITIMHSNTTIDINAIPNNEGLVISGFTGSTAETYATENNITFIALEQWDVSATAEDNVVVTYYPLTKRLSLDGTGNMQNWASESDVPWYSYRNDIKFIDIAQNVTSIGANAFRNLGACAVIIPNNIVSIGKSAFYTYNCEIYCEAESLPSGWDASWRYASTTVVWGIKAGGKTEDGYYWVQTPEDKIKIISCDANQSIVVIPSIINSYPVTTIGDSAFRNCRSLNSITIPESITTIEDHAFDRCDVLTEINFNAINMSDLKSGNEVFGYAGQSGDGIKVIIGKNVTRIPAFLFSPYGYQTKAKIISVEFEVNSKCEVIGDYAFRGCSSLTNIEIPNSVTSIDNYAFYHCTNLTNAVIGNSVISIGENVFEGCNSLISVTIGQSIATIGYHAFYDCNKLVEVYNLSSLNITSGSTNNGYIGYYALNVYTPKNGIKKTCRTEDDVVLYDAGNVYYLLGYFGAETNIVLPENYNGKKYDVYDYAFYKCTSLTSIEIPSGVTNIGKAAFSGCASLTSVNYLGTVE